MPASSWAIPTFSPGLFLTDSQNATVGSTAVALGTATSLCSAVLIQSSNSNSGTVYVGTKTGQHFELTTGQAVTIPCQNLGQVYLRYPTGGGVVNYLSLGT